MIVFMVRMTPVHRCLQALDVHMTFFVNTEYHRAASTQTTGIRSIADLRLLIKLLCTYFIFCKSFSRLNPEPDQLFTNPVPAPPRPNIQCGEREESHFIQFSFLTLCAQFLST